MPGRLWRVSLATDLRREPGIGDRSPRLFFALLPDVGAREALGMLAQDVARTSGGRAVRAENLHLPLAFLGSVPQARVATVAAIGASAASRAKPFLLTLDRVGLFRNAGIAWAAPQAGSPDLQQIFETLREALRTAGLPVERRALHPHVTLARRCTRGLPAATMAPIAWRADAMALIASETLPDGPRYRELAAWRFPEAADVSPR